MLTRHTQLISTLQLCFSSAKVGRKIPPWNKNPDCWQIDHKLRTVECKTGNCMSWVNLNWHWHVFDDPYHPLQILPNPLNSLLVLVLLLLLLLLLFPWRPGVIRVHQVTSWLFVAFQQLKVISASTRSGQSVIVSKTQDRNTKSITVAHSTACHSMHFFVVPQPDRRETQQFTVSMHDLHVYLNINTTTTLLMLWRQKYTCMLPNN